MLGLGTQSFFSSKPSKLKKFLMTDKIPGVKVLDKPKLSLLFEAVPLGVSVREIITFLDVRYELAIL